MADRLQARAPFERGRIIQADAGVARPHRKAELLLTTALVIVVAGAVPQARADNPTVNWLGTSSGDWFDGANWSGGAVPDADDIVVIDTDAVNGTVVSPSSGSSSAEVGEITLADTNSASLTVENGATLTTDYYLGIAKESSVTGNVLVTGSGSTLNVGDELEVAIAGTGVLTIADGGTLNVTGLGDFKLGLDTDTSVATLNIGAPSGETPVAPGTLNAAKVWSFNSSETTFVFNHTASEDDPLVFAVPIEVSTDVSSASLNIQSGYTVFSADSSAFASDVLIEGGTMALTNAFAAASVIVGDEPVGGSLSIEAGGTMSADTIILGNVVAGVGTTTVSGTGATLDVAGSFLVADNGTAYLTVASGGAVTASDGFTAGNAYASAGTVTVTGSGSTLTVMDETLFVADAGQALMTVSDSGGVTSGNGLVIGNASKSSGAVTVTGSGSVLDVTAGTTKVGNSGSGSLTVADGATVTAAGGLVIGNGSKGSGTLTLTDAGSALTVGDTLIVGNKGHGTLSVAAGAVNFDGTIDVAREDGSTGTLAIGAAAGNSAAAAGSVSAAIAFGSGTGTLVFNHTASSGSPLDFANTLSGKATVEVLGGQTTLSGDIGDFSAEALTVDGAGLTLESSLDTKSLVVGDTGTGSTLSIANEATLAVSGDATIGSAAGSDGTVTIAGAATGSDNKVTASTLKVSGDLVVGGSGSGTLVANQAGALSLDGGKGTLTIAQEAGSTGALIVGAPSGESALGTPTLSLKAVAFGDGNGSVLFNHADETGTYTIAAPFSGKGTIGVAAGTTVLSGDSSAFTGSTDISGGALTVAGTLPGAITVKDGATLSVTGTVSGAILAEGGAMLTGDGTASGAITVQGLATLAPGASSSSPGTLKTGDVTFDAGSTLAIAIDTDGTAAALQSTGTVELQGGTVSVDVDDYFVDTAFTIVTADKVDGTFADVSGSTTFIGYVLGYDKTTITLTQTVKQSFASVGASANQIALGAALDSLPTTHTVVQHAYGAMSGAEARAIYDSLSGEVHASLSGALMNNGRDISAAVSRRLASADHRFGPEPQGSEDDVTAMPNGIWAAGFGGWNHIGATGNTASADNDYGGIVGGFDRRINETFRLGLFGAYAHTDLSQASRSASADADSVSAGLYGSAVHGPLFAGFGGLGSWHDIASRRTVPVRGTAQRLTADYDATSFQLFGEAGYRIEHQRLNVEPFGGLSFMQLYTDGFSESGGSAALTAASNEESTLFTTLGLRAGWQVTEMVRAYGSAGWRHAFGDVDPETTLTLAGSSPFSIAGAPIAEDELVLGAGFAVEVADRLTLEASYNGQFGDNSTDNQVKGLLSLRF